MHHLGHHAVWLHAEKEEMPLFVEEENQAPHNLARDFQ